MTRLEMLRWMIAIMVLVAAMWIGLGLLTEAYGSRAPHYGGTANMDKWTSPWPTVGLVIGVAIIIIAIVAPWRRLSRVGRQGRR